MFHAVGRALLLVAHPVDHACESPRSAVIASDGGLSESGVIVTTGH
ncbi:hypothetical protein ES5_13878 [Dietzia cinnamea P4]|nr:hypothetical protein ES5_13878 [Dietzia cinnamea P4]